jgi:hypothetical protein
MSFLSLLTTEIFSSLTTTATTTTTISTTTSDAPNTTDLIPIEIQKCKAVYGNSTGFITNAYEGIPENLIVNLCLWTALVILYTLLRNIGDYGRFGLIKNDEERFFLFSFLHLYKFRIVLFLFWSPNYCYLDSIFKIKMSRL